ncbi:dCTP deaminase [Aureibaculum luteum]|uniref:dCTP deaminase n=1 Tax=Aureibaculum luteum TaxID=1548456 RepID=UPI000E5056B4|nr:dCTP deaminase [Aureibaculum luteum]
MGKTLLKKIIGDNSPGILAKPKILELIRKKELIITPMLEENQIGEISVDLRIGTDFLAMQQGRKAFIDTTNNDITSRSIKSNFTESRRRIGETFLLHPTQTILFSTLEYLKLPNNVYANLTLRSSYSRLGLIISSFLQPGYIGCASVEVVNSGNTAIQIISGARFLQAKFIKINDNSNYFNSHRKYTCQVRPVSSKANEDEEITTLKKMIEYNK